MKTLTQITDEVEGTSWSNIFEVLKIWTDFIIDEAADIVIAMRPDISSQDITELKERLL